MGLKNWFKKRPSAAEMREELETHLQMRAAHEGTDETAARRRFGNLLQTEEALRRVWIASFFDTLAQDARFTWRSWLRNPVFAVAGVIVLALGLGAATALFSALDRILFRPLPYPASDRLVSMGLLMAGPDGRPRPEIMPDKSYFQVWQPAPEPFEATATIVGEEPCDLTEDQPERLTCVGAEASLLRTLGVRVFAGRDFAPEDDLRGRPRVVLLRHGFWLRRFGGDLTAIGRTIRLDGQPATVIGILPPDFEFIGREADILHPQQLLPLDPKQPFIRFLAAVGRLKPDVSPQQADAAVQPLLPGMRESFPGRLTSNAPLRVRSLRDRQMSDATRTAWLLLGAVALLLLIACVNVANLMLARFSARGREFAVRSALGAGKVRLARLALTESMLLAFTAGALGLAIAAGLLKVFVAMAPATIPKIGQATLDVRVWVVAAALAVLTGLAAGLWPAISVLRSRDLHGSRATGGAKPLARFALVTVQIALTVTLLSGSALLLRSLWNQANVPLGFDAENVIHLQVVLNVARYTSPEQESGFLTELLQRIRRMPGTVAAASNTAPTPLDISGAIALPRVEGREPDPNASGVPVRQRFTTTQYFETYRIPFIRGRGFLEEDLHAVEPAAVLNTSLERLLFGSDSGLGKRIQPQRDGPWRVVVGVVPDVRNNGLSAEPQPELYLLRPPDRSGRFGYFAIRTTAGFKDAAAFLERAVASLDPQLPVTIQPAEERVAVLTERPRFIAWLLAAFAGSALLLASAGLYGVASYLVTQRTRDIGVRMALGAAPRDIAGQLVGEAGKWIAAGAAAGVVLSWAGTRAVESQLYGIGAADPASWAASLALLGISLLAAVLRPAARASRVDPAAALRAE
jgi:putative ABC transport system permease protein